MVRDPSRRRLALSDRLIEVIDDRQTGETILDEALKMLKSSEKYGVGAWVDLMSGEFAVDLWRRPGVPCTRSDRSCAHNCTLRSARRIQCCGSPETLTSGWYQQQR